MPNKLNMVESLNSLPLGPLRVQMSQLISVTDTGFDSIEGLDSDIARFEAQIAVLTHKVKVAKLHRAYLEVCNTYGWRVLDVSDYFERESVGYLPFIGTRDEIFNIVRGTHHEEDCMNHVDYDPEADD